VKLKPTGPAGTQKIFDETLRFMDFNNLKFPAVIVDSDVIKNEAEEEEVLATVRSERPSVTIATSMIFGRRYQLNFPLIAVLNADAMVNIPDFRTDEKILYQISKLKDMRPARLVIQTHDPLNKVFEYILSGSDDQFFENELSVRKTFGYPPSKQLIKLTYKSKNRERASYSARVLASKLKMALMQGQIKDKFDILGPSPAFIEKERGQFIYNIVLKLGHQTESLREILKFIPSNWIIDVDPKTVL
jgi:primosomal protein N' (replication factor Y)